MFAAFAATMSFLESPTITHCEGEIPSFSQACRRGREEGFFSGKLSPPMVSENNEKIENDERKGSINSEG